MSYEAAIANGRGSALDEIQVTADTNENKAVFLGLGYHTPKVTGLEFHLSYYQDVIPLATPLDERIFGLAATYVDHGWEVRAEWSEIEHESGGAIWTTSGGYAFVSYSIPRTPKETQPSMSTIWQPLRQARARQAAHWLSSFKPSAQASDPCVDPVNSQRHRRIKHPDRSRAGE